jgi:hypothetical protein
MMDYDAKGEEMTQMGLDWLRKTLAYHPTIGGYPEGEPKWEAQGGDVRICFAVAYFTDKAEAEAAGEWSSRHNTYNGGMFHGMPCRRDPSFDFKWQGVVYHAVTH